MKKQPVIWFMLALLSMLAAANICWAVEEDEDGNIRQSQPLALEGDDSVAPKPKVIIKERVVMKCAPGTVWSPRNKRCISEDGEAPPPPRYQAPAHRQQAEAPRGDRYVYPGTKLRMNIGKCTMRGETVSCAMNITNTVPGNVRPTFDNATITDNYGVSYKLGDLSCAQYGGGCSWGAYGIDYGGTKIFYFVFPLVNPDTTTLNFSALANANNGSDTVKFNGIPLIK